MSPIAKVTGLSWTTLSIDDAGGTPVIIKNDVTDLTFAMPRGVIDVTGVDKAAYERLLGLADFTVNLKGIFNAATSHTAFSTIATSSATRTLSMTVAGASLATLEVILTDYQIARTGTGELNWTVPGQLCNGTAPVWT